MSKKLTLIGVSHMWVGAPFDAAITSKANLVTAVGKLEAITNIHEGTYAPEQDDDDETEYKDELTGETYATDVTSYGAERISFKIGQYDLETYAKFIGGKTIDSGDGWQSDTKTLKQNLAIVVMTNEGNIIAFSNASVKAKNSIEEKANMIEVKATAMKSDVANVATKYRWDGSGFEVDSTGKLKVKTAGA